MKYLILLLPILTACTEPEKPPDLPDVQTKYELELNEDAVDKDEITTEDVSVWERLNKTFINVPVIM
jgi:hypothetical protein